MGRMSDHCTLCRAKVPASHEECIEYLRPWLKKKKAWAMSMMGHMYRDGEGVKQSYEMARRLFEQAAQQGDVGAMSNLGRLYELAAQQGYVTAMYNLGVMYKDGEGVEQSYERAFEYYEQAADLGDAAAQTNLGILLHLWQWRS